MAIENSSQDLANVDPSDAAATEQAEGGANDDGSIRVCIALSQDGTISVYDEGGNMPQVTAKNLAQACQIATQMIQHLAKGQVAQQSKDAQMQRPGMEDAQSVWDQMASARPNRMNT